MTDAFPPPDADPEEPAAASTLEGLFAQDGPAFDEIIHAPTRLRICAALDTASELEFSLLESSLQISTSLLSKQLKVLTDVGYVRLDKRKQPFGRPRTWVSLTSLGRRRYRDHVRALRAIISGE